MPLIRSVLIQQTVIMTICIKFLLTCSGSVVGEGEELLHLLLSVRAGMTSEFKHARREPLMCGGAGGQGQGGSVLSWKMQYLYVT